MNENELHKTIKDRIADIHERSITAKEIDAELRDDLVVAIQEAKDAGIPYREIGNILGIGKTGVSAILTRGNK